MPCVFFRVNGLLQIVNLYFSGWERNESYEKFQGNFCEISEIPKIRENFPGNFPEIFWKTQCVF